MISYNYNKSDDILYVQFSGDISIEDLLEHITTVGSNKEVPRILRTLEDRRGATFNFSIRDNLRIAQRAIQFAKNYNKVYLAALNEKPIGTAFAIDYQMLLSKFTSKQTSKAFTTFEAAQHWLMNVSVFVMNEE